MLFTNTFGHVSETDKGSGAVVFTKHDQSQYIKETLSDSEILCRVNAFYLHRTYVLLLLGRNCNDAFASKSLKKIENWDSISSDITVDQFILYFLKFCV